MKKLLNFLLSMRYEMVVMLTFLLVIGTLMITIIKSDSSKDGADFLNAFTGIITAFSSVIGLALVYKISDNEKLQNERASIIATNTGLAHLRYEETKENCHWVRINWQTASMNAYLGRDKHSLVSFLNSLEEKWLVFEAILPGCRSMDLYVDFVKKLNQMLEMNLSELDQSLLKSKLDYLRILVDGFEVSYVIMVFNVDRLK